MLDIVQSRQTELRRACQEFRVLRLALFGSALRSDFDPVTSDLDFVVEFLPMGPQEHARAYFGLADELERVFKRSVDLVEESAVFNPYVRRNIEASQGSIYAA
jgi:hypothetical protein